MTTEMISSVSIEAMVARRNAIIERFVAIREHALAMEQLAAESFVGVKLTHIPEIEAGSFSQSFSVTRKDGLETYTKRVDASFWRALLERTQIQQVMSQAVRNQWRDSLEKCTTPTFTLEAVLPTIQALYDNRHTMLSEAVVELFRLRSWDKKTNRPEKFTPKQIWFYGTYVHESDHWVESLHRILHLLDGRPEPDWNGSVKGIIYARGSIGKNYAGTYDHDYWSMTVYKNGNAHLTIKRQDLVDKLNDIVAARYPFALPGARK